MDSPKKTARIAGLLYLVMAITGAFGLMYVPTSIVVSGDAAATAGNILAHGTLFRLGIVSNLICQTVFVFLVLTLYRLFKEVDEKKARLMVALVLVSVPIAFLNELNQVAALILLSGADYLKKFQTEQLHTMVMVFRNLYEYGIGIAEVFWGLWLFPFGVLVYKSKFLPKILGILLMIACFGYLAESFAFLLFPDQKETVTLFTSWTGAIGEFSILLWLLIMGVKDKPSTVPAN